MIVLEGVLGRCRLLQPAIRRSFFRGRAKFGGLAKGNLSPPKDTRKKEGLIAGYFCCHIGKKLTSWLIIFLV